MQKPTWLNKKINLTDCRKVTELLGELKLNTVCQEALCPNKGECFKSQVATFMILGSVCSRSCAFCGIEKGKPQIIDVSEPERIAQAVERLNLNYVVITSPTRDDLPDGGAQIFAETVKAIKYKDKHRKVELLIPDLAGNCNALRLVANCSAEVISHNLETVPSLYIKVRQGANYQRSLDVLRVIKQENPNVFTKSGIMLGLGENNEEIAHLLEDLLKINCDFLTIGQYLPPSRSHYQLKEYISPQIFEFWQKQAYKLGFKKVKSSPYTRSSYLAHEFLD